MANVLVIDDDEHVGSMVSNLVRKMDHYAEYALTLGDGLKKVRTGSFDVVFLDVRMPDGSGLEALKGIQGMSRPPEVIIVTGFGDTEGAEIAIKSGAWDYLQKPLPIKKVMLSLKRVLQYRENLNGSEQPTVHLKRGGIIGGSPPLEKCLNTLAYAAGGVANVLITGETGAGKGLFARALHESSPRCKKNFVVVDCAALPETLVESLLFGHEKGSFTGADKSTEGLIRQADQGTLFLDEVCEMDLSLQKTFLRVLQEKMIRPLGSSREKPCDFRLVAATNKNPGRMVEKGLFREDLLYRLKSISIELPPLRSRLEDIPDLILHHVKLICEKTGVPLKGFSPDFIEVLQSYSWPGNVRELVHAMEDAISRAGSEPILFSKHLPANIRIQTAKTSLESEIASSDEPRAPVHEAMEQPDGRPPTYGELRETVLAEAEKKYFTHLLRYTGGDIKEACRFAKLGRTRLYDLLKKHNISRARAIRAS